MSDKAPEEWRLTEREQSLYKAGYERGAREAVSPNPLDARVRAILTGHKLSALEWARERLANTLRLAGDRVGADRDGWVEDAAYWQVIVQQLDVPPTPPATGAWVRDFSKWASVIVAHVRNIDHFGQSEGLSPEDIVTRVLAEMFPSPPYGARDASVSQLGGIIDEMRRLNTAVNAAHGSTDYQVALVGLALVARQFLRELPERCSFDGNLRPCPHHDLPPTGWSETREKSE